ncbi:FAD:protein FMN transferase [Streptomyces sp. NPDC020379]|uniref:FAD:protein FMN transferase n=1 Tax=Streptomyces sp. NPDC020379 TaxID=3365071 RepID=UPI0037B670BC
MGTVFSFDLRDTVTPAVGRALREAVTWLHHVDALFSTYRPDSAICRLDRGETTVERCPAEVGEVLRLCAEAEALTRGWFSARAGGRLDPSGLVKGWAVERAAAVLHEAGARNLCVNGGGDLRLHGEAAPGTPWRIGIADPTRPGRLLTVVTADVPAASAVATSGTAERGHHILDPHAHRPARGLLSTTVIGPSLIWADVHATAIFARGAVMDAEGYEVLTLAEDGRIGGSGGFARAVTDAGSAEG